jgi:tetratricopeptide (TPR) repeat protein
MVAMGIETGQPEYQLARVLKVKGDNDGAIESYKDALEKTPTAVMALQGLAQTLVESDRGAEALTYIENLSAEHPDRHDIKFLLGALYANQGEPEKAEAMFEEVIAARPDADRVYETLAVLNAADAAKLQDIFQRGVDDNPDSERLSMLLGNQYASAGRYEEALEVYEKFLVRNEDSQIAVNNVAAMLLDHREDIGSHARALELVTRFRNVRHPVLLDTLGWAYYRNGRYLDAVRYLEMAVAGAGQVAEMRYHLGMAYNATRNPVGAKQELRTAIELAERSEGQVFVGLDEARAMLDDLTAASSGAG